MCVYFSSKHLSLHNFYNILLVYFAHYICTSLIGKLQEIRILFFLIQKKSHYQRYILPRKLICITGQPVFSNHLLSLSCEWSSTPLHPQIYTPFLSLGWYISFNFLIVLWVSMKLPYACIRACACVCVCVLSRVQFFATPRTVVHQAHLSMDFPSKLLEYMPFPPPGDLANPGTEPTFPTLVGDSLSLSHLGRHPPPHP